MTRLGYPEPGEMLGPYRIVRRLGFGGMGVVFEAMEGTLHRPVALKVISSQLADDEGFRARFVHEAQAQASVRSPHVVPVYSQGETDGRLYIATELVDGGDLGRLVQEHGPPPLATALDVIAQVASGLADAHAVGLVHRDIKPANVLLRRGPHGLRAYLADFGIACQAGAAPGRTGLGATVGTPSYMAPELHTGGQAGIESDVYSLGCLLWTAITGAAPYAGTSDHQIASAHLTQPVPQLPPGPSAANAVNRVLLRALAKSPTDRYSDAAEMSRDLRAAASVTSGRASRLGLVAAALVLLLASGIGAVVALATTGDESADPEPAASPSVDDQRAIASLTAALSSEGRIGEGRATCVAKAFIAAAGLDALADAGLFDENLNYVDRSQDAITPRMRKALTSAVSDCSLSGLRTP